METDLGLDSRLWLLLKPWREARGTETLQLSPPPGPLTTPQPRRQERKAEAWALHSDRPGTRVCVSSAHPFL